MKVVTPIRSRRNHRALVAALLSYLMLMGQAAPLALAAVPQKPKPPKTSTITPSKGEAKPALPNTKSPLSPSGVTATMTGAITTDADSDGKADPGVDTITYTATITNTSGGDLSNLQFTDTVDSHTTLVAGSATASTDDHFNTIGNVNINVAAGQGVLANDFDPNTGTNAGISVTSYGASTGSEQTSLGTATATAQGGVVAVNADGSFTYDPATGFTGNDTFKYVAKKGSDGSLTATVTISVAGRIWFVNNAGGACSSNCDGRLSHPFTSLANFQAINDNNAALTHAKTGDSIFLYQSGIGYTGPVTLLNNQKLIGQDATSSLITITGLTQPSGTDPLPAMAPADGTIATINASAANGVNLGQGNTIRGLTVSGTTGAKISGSGFGTLLVGDSASPDVSLSGGGQALSLTSGTLANTSGFAGVASTSSSATGVTLDNVSVASNGTVSFGSTSISGGSGQGILVQNCTTGNSCGGTIAFGNTTVAGGTDGVAFTNNNAGARTFGTLGVSGGSGNAFKHTKGANSTGGGNVTVNGLATLSTTAGGDPVEIADVASGTTINFAGGASVTKSSAGGEGVHLSGANGGSTLTFASLTVQTSGGTGLSLASTTTTAIVNVTNNTGTVNNTTQAAPAIVANGVQLNANFSAIKSSGGTNGVSLTNVTGTSNFGSGAISGNTGDAFLISGGTISVSYSGTVASGSAHSVNISGMTGGGATLSGAITDTDTGILLNNNTGATFTFSGGISANTGTSDAFTATGGGTINVTGTNTITNTTGKAVNIANTTIGASNVTFQSINHNASNSGTNSAIILNNTGSGTFTVAGTGGSCTTATPTCTGGTIQNIQGADAISINNTGGLVTLNNMLIEDISASNDATAADDTHSNFDAINGVAVNGGLTLNNSIIQRISDSGINGSIDGATPGSTPFNGLTITNSVFSLTNRFNIAGHGDANFEAAVFIVGLKGTVSVTGSIFQNCASGLDLTTDSTGSLDATITGNQFNTLYKEPGGTASKGNYGISVFQKGSLNSVVRIGDKNDSNAALGNTFSNGGRLAAMRVITDSASTGTMKAEINRNTSTVTDHSTPGCGSPQSNCTQYNFPQGGLLLRPLGSGNFEGIAGHNTFDQVMHADGGLGQITIQAENGVSEFIVQNNTFKLPWDMPIQIISQKDTATAESAAVLLTGNTYIGGTVGDATTDLGGPSPFDPFYAQARNNGRLDLTVQNEATA
ncbi:MAG TPA: Ig-like domain-containing protein, partial [Pyrinomonadaceae bacterium]|nr:Ig-like domain-containing protein [Pyrinomonadaceae bacterium]